MNHQSPAANPIAKDETTGIARATGWLALGNISSRLLGLAREMLLANLFGATPLAEALRVAIIIPRTLYDLFIGGNLNSAIIPVFSAVEAKEGRASLWQLISLLLTLVGLLLATVVLVLVWWAQPIIQFVAPNTAAATAEMPAQLLRITAPGLWCFGAFAILNGALLAIRSFRWPAFAVTLFNGTIVLILVAIGLSQQLNAGERIRGAALAWFLATLVMLLSQWVGLRQVGWRLRLPRWHPQLRQILRLALPVLVTLLLDVLVTRLFTYRLANQSGPGSINYLELGTTLIQFPQGLVAAAISLAILPTMARHASQAETDRQASSAFRETLNHGLRLATVLILPAAALLFLLAPAVVALLFQHGAFLSSDSQRTAEVLRYYLPGLPFAAIDLILIYAFYARQDTRSPAIIGAICLLFYMAVATALHPSLGLLSLMLADSIKHILHATLSAWLLQRKTQALSYSRWWHALWRSALAALSITIVTAFLFAWLHGTLGGGRISSTLSLTASSILAIFLYLQLLRRLGVSELHDFLRHLLVGEPKEP